MRRDGAAQMADQHLRPEADPEIGLVLSQRNRMPVDLVAHEVVFVIGAHRAAENHRAGMFGECFGQRIAKRVAADVQFEAGALQHLPDTAGA